MKSVFVCHSSSDKAVADMIVESLENDGISAWIAPRDIPAGSDYGASIIRGLRECEVLVLVFSKMSNESDAVIREVQFAFNKKKAIVPFRIENVPAGDSLEFYLSGLHWVDAVNNSKYVDVLLKDIKGILQNLDRTLGEDLASEIGNLPPSSDAGIQLTSPTPAPTPAPAPAQTLAKISVGDIIEFGNLDWHVHDVKGNQALIIAGKVITTRWYHHTLEALTWEDSEIRQWLNGEFFSNFSPSDQARIAKTNVINYDNPWDFSEWGGWVNTPGGNNTTDMIFLLSIDEVLRYFGDSGLVAHGATMGVSGRGAYASEMLFSWGIIDQYSEARNALDMGGHASWWWLRSPGGSPRRAASVSSTGSLVLDGGSVFWSGGVGGGVRPALWLYLES